jgi:hypothetical protein
LLNAGAANAGPPPNPINQPPVHVNQCAIDPSLCPPQPPPPPPPPPQPPNPSGNGGNNGSGNGANNGSVNGLSSTGGGASTASQTGTGQAASVPAGGVPLMHKDVKHASDSSSSDGLFLVGGSVLAASLAGLAGLVVWRRRRAVA